MPERDRTEEHRLIQETVPYRGREADGAKLIAALGFALDRLITEADTAERDLDEARKALEFVAKFRISDDEREVDTRADQLGACGDKARAALASLPDTDSEGDA